MYIENHEETEQKTAKRKIRVQKRLSTEYCIREVRSVEKSLTNRGLEMLELREWHRLGGHRDGVVVPVEVLTDRVDRALTSMFVTTVMTTRNSKSFRSPESSRRN